MSKAVQEQVDKLFEAVKDLHSLKEIKPHCEAFNEFINLKTTYTKDSLGTVLSRCGFYKKFKSLPLEQGKNADLVPKHDKEGNIKGHELQHYCLLLCGLSKEDWFDRNNTTRINDRLSGDGQEVIPETYLQLTGKLLESNNPHELAVGLIAATGRRPHEILARAKFYPVKGENYHVMFEGQGKKRGEKPVFKIATLYPANYIVKKLNQLRELTTDFIREIESEFKDDIATQNRKIEDRRGNSLRRVVQEYFGGKESKTPVLNFRDSEEQNDCKALRAAYLCLATERDCKGSLGSKMLHAAKLAGHFTNETPTDRDLNHLVTTLGYADYFTTKPVTFPMTETIMTTKPTTIKCSPETRDAINKLCKELGNVSQAQSIEKLIEVYQQKPDTNQSEKLAELEVNYQELVKVNKANNETIKNQELEIKKLQELINKQLESIAAQHETINTQKTQIKELETMIDTQATQAPANTANRDLEALEARFEARLQQLEELIINKISQPPVVTSQELPVPSPQSPVPSYQSAARDKNQKELEGMTDTELWKSRKTGVTEEKVRRCFVALTDYNNEVATGDGDRVAVTNIVLRQLSGANGQVVGGWMEQHKDEILQHNNKHCMGNQKEPNNLYTVFNRGKDVDKYLEVVRKSMFRE
jgi:hypothetical protein